MTTHNPLRRVRQFLITSACIFVLLTNNSVRAKDLAEIIPGLYGGDGVQLVAASQGFSHAPHFQDTALIGLNRIQAGISGLDLPTPSPAGGIVYSFDPILNEFVGETSALGPQFTQNAQTLTKGAFVFGFASTHMNFDKYDGQELTNYNIDLAHVDLAAPGADICIGGPPGSCYAFENDVVTLNLDIELDSTVLFAYASYGLTDRIDVSATVPVIKNRLRVDASATVQEHESAQFFPGNLHRFDHTPTTDPITLNGDAPNDSGSGSSTGIGDIHLQARYQIFDKANYGLVANLGLRLPTGDRDNFMGIDRYSPTIATSFSTKNGFIFDNLNVHLSTGYTANNTYAGNDLVSFDAAADYQFSIANRAMNATFEVLSSKNIDAPNNGHSIRIDAVLGIKWALDDHSMVFTNIRGSLKNKGLRSAPGIMVGFERSI